MLRVVYVLTALMVITLPLMPVQWLAVKFRHPLRRKIPVFYHRTMCRLLGPAPAQDATRPTTQPPRQLDPTLVAARA